MRYFSTLLLPALFCVCLMACNKPDPNRPTVDNPTGDMSPLTTRFVGLLSTAPPTVPTTTPTTPPPPPTTPPFTDIYGNPIDTSVTFTIAPPPTTIPPPQPPTAQPPPQPRPRPPAPNTTQAQQPVGKDCRKHPDKPKCRP